MLYLVDSADIHLRSGTRQTNAGLGRTGVLIIPITSSDQLLYGELLSNQMTEYQMLFINIIQDEEREPALNRGRHPALRSCHVRGARKQSR